MKRRITSFSPSKGVLIVISALFWLATLIILAVMLVTEGENSNEPVYGSLEGRFESSVTLEHEGEILRYRMNEITNYLIIGVDKTNVTEGSNYRNGGQADFLVVLAIDRVSRSITPVMLDRDAMVDVQTYGVFGDPSGTRTMQLCLAQSYSGEKVSGSVNTAQTVESLLKGIDIHHYVVLDMEAIPLINDAIGGVEVTLYDDFTEFDPTMESGKTMRLMGRQAEFFVRGRMTVADGTNASRMARQQQYLTALLTQFRKTVQGDQAKLNSVLDAAEGHMTSDALESALLRDVNAYGDYEWNALRLLEGEHKIDTYGFAEFWIDDVALNELVADIWFK